MERSGTAAETKSKQAAHSAAASEGSGKLSRPKWAGQIAIPLRSIAVLWTASAASQRSGPTVISTVQSPVVTFWAGRIAFFIGPRGA